MMNNIKTFPFIIILALVIGLAGCQKFLTKEPLGVVTQTNLFKDSVNAIEAVNSIYDASSWDEGPKWGDPHGPYQTHFYEWFIGDAMSDDAAKGSTPSDFSAITDLKTWTANPSNLPLATLWSNCFTGINRANTVINNIDEGTVSDQLKSRLKGEALFFRGYFYFFLVRVFGGVPLFEKTPAPSETQNITRSSIGETYAFIEKDLNSAANLLPEKSGYAAADLGRATKGAALSYLTRVILYQLGTVNGNNHSWQDVYDLTGKIVNSNQYGLFPNYATIWEDEGENGIGSIFEIQFKTSNDAGGPIKSGTTNNVFQNNRSTWGYGFNNPTQNLVNSFEPLDPRLPCTVYKNGDIVLGIFQQIDLATNETGYLNRKAAILKPAQVKAGGQNIRKIRYADILLMRAEAAAHLQKNTEAVDLVNKIRDRARNASKPKGSKLGSLTYEANNPPSGTLPDLSSTLSGQDLLNAIWHERRVEFGEESLRYWDLIRTGRYLDILPPDVKSSCQTHSFTQNTVNPVPLVPIPLNEVQTWKLQQNPGY
jgi:hypothetical protein